MTVIESQQSFEETLDALNQAIEARGLRLFDRIDHASNAVGAGLELDPTVVFIFGNPKVGSKLMAERRTVAIDLPQKMLVWKDSESVYVGFNDPSWLGTRHQLETPVLAKIKGLLNGIATAAIGA